MAYKFIKHPHRQESEVISLKSAVDKAIRRSLPYNGGVAETAGRKADGALGVLGRLLDELSEKRDLLTKEQWSYIVDGYNSDSVVWVDDNDENVDDE